MARNFSSLKWQAIAFTAILASASSVAQADAQGSHRTFNVKSFGATGNGTTDDTTAIQAALTAAANTGAQVVFPSGTYLISSSLTGTGLAVVGSNATLLTNTDNVTLLNLTGTSPSCTTMAFKAANGLVSVTGIEAFNATNANVTNCSFGSNFFFSVIYDVVTGGTITSNNLPSVNGSTGIAAENSSNITITKNVVAQTSNSFFSVGILELGGQNDVVQGNTVTWGTNKNSFGILSESSTSPQVVKNTVNAGGFGITSQFNTTAVIDHNVVSNSTSAGLFSNQDTTTVISNNSVSNVVNDAIRTTGSSAVTVTTNAIDGAGGNGIMSSNGGNVSITNNAIANCALTHVINAIIRVNDASATAISITGNQYKGNTANVTDFIHVIQTFATVSGNKTNSLLPTVVGP